jgi:hypothetical protein
MYPLPPESIQWCDLSTLLVSCFSLRCCMLAHEGDMHVYAILHAWKHAEQAGVNNYGSVEACLHPKMKYIFASLMCPPSTVYIHRLQYPPPVGSSRLTYSLILLHVYTSLQDIFEKTYLLKNVHFILFTTFTTKFLSLTVRRF